MNMDVDKQSISAMTNISHAKKSPVLNMLGEERTQKLNLLVHSVINLQDTLILRGLDGTGKTTLLNQFAELEINNVDIHYLQVHSATSFESIQLDLCQFITSIYALNNHSLSEILNTYEKDYRQLVVLIDNSEELLSGLMSHLVEFAYRHKALRLVFAITPDAFNAKRASEHITSQSTFVELPLLSQHQSKRFVRKLLESKKKNKVISRIDEKLIHQIYRETQGNLSKIIAIIDEQKKPAAQKMSPIVLPVAIISAVVITIMVGIRLWPQATIKTVEPAVEKQRVSLKQPKIATVEKKLLPTAEPVELIKTPKIDTALILAAIENDTDIIVEKNPLEASIKEPVKTDLSKKEESNSAKLKISKELKNPVIVKPAERIKEKTVLENKPAKQEELVKPKPVKKEVVKPKTKQKVNWITAQKFNPAHYTLQLYTLSTKPQLVKVRKELKAKGYETYYVRNKSRKYLVFHGNFKSKKAAKQQSLKLPENLQNAWIRPFRSIQNSL